MSIITSLNIIVKHADEGEPDTSEDDEEYQIIMAVSGANDCRNHPVMVVLDLNHKMVDMEVDTGAAATLTVKWHTRVWPNPTPLLIPLLLSKKVVNGCYSMTFPNYCLTVFGQKFSLQLAFVSEI